MGFIGAKYIFKNVEERPEKIDEGIVYVCLPDMVAELKCPCGCRDDIELNLVDVKPSWKVNGNSITPSINKLYGCKSHFTITNGVTH